jgi:hypothetical protein
MSQSDIINSLKTKLRDIILVDDILNLLEGKTYLDIVKRCDGNTKADAITCVHNVVSFLDSIGASSLSGLLFNNFSDFRNFLDKHHTDLVNDSDQLRHYMEKLEHQVTMANTVLTTCKMNTLDKAALDLINEYEKVFPKEE